MVSDAHFIPPTDGKVNGIYLVSPHGNVATASITTLNGSKLGTCCFWIYWNCFEPAPALKAI
jgi:hypothetical protein